MAINKQEWIQKTLLSPQHRGQIEQWMRDSKSVKILVTGKTGVGKSTLINGIVGQDVAEEGETLDPNTSKVTAYKLELNGVDVEIYDSPGLQDGTKKEKEYLQDMEHNCKQVDLVLYCTMMTANRVGSDDKEAIEKLTNAFGTVLWENAIFVLTFANELKPHRESNAHTYFTQRLTQWKEKLHGVLIENKVSPETVQRVAVVPVGYYTEPALPDREHWLSSLWLSCINQMSVRAKPAFLKINWSRLRTRDEVKLEEFRRKINEQPIVYSNDTLGAVTVPRVILQLLGLPPRIGVAGTFGSQVGSAVGTKAAGTTGSEIGGIAGAIIAELVWQYGTKYFQ